MKAKLFFYFIFPYAALYMGCIHSEKKNNTASSKTNPLARNKCHSCHQLESDGNIAPSIASIHNFYSQTFSKKEDYTAAMEHFLQNVSNENAHFKDAVAKYGLMPNFEVNKEEANAIAEYIYEKRWLQKDTSELVLAK